MLPFFIIIFCVSLYVYQDAYWVLFNANPLRCTSPSDVYILLKSSDLITHDTDAVNVFSGCVDVEPGEEESNYELELVLRKWYCIERNREVRCFVRNRRLIGESSSPPYSAFL